MGIDGKDEIEIIREVFTYINRFKDKIFVIKIDNNVIEDAYFPVLLKDLATLYNAGIRIIIVPGARKRIDEVFMQYGISSAFHGGVRITSEDAVPFVKMAAFDVTNKIMTGLAGLQINALVGNWIRAKGMGVIDGVDFKYTGEVDRILVDPLQRVIDDLFVPIIPVVGWNPVGRPYNLSSDDIALQVAYAVGAEKLFFISQEATLNVNDFSIPPSIVSAPDGRISRLDEAAGELFLSLNKEKSERLRTFRKALQGVNGGIKRVHIINSREGKGILAEIFSNLGTGTMIFQNEFDRIRAMKPDDIPEVLRLMQPFVQKGVLIPRDEHSLMDTLETFVVYETDGLIHGCASLLEWENIVGEIAGVAVDPEYEKLGIGRKLIMYLISKASRRKFKRLFLLTTRTADWFESRGFSVGGLEDLPEAKRVTYNFTRNSRIMIMNLQQDA